MNLTAKEKSRAKAYLLYLCGLFILALLLNFMGEIEMSVNLFYLWFLSLPVIIGIELASGREQSEEKPEEKEETYSLDGDIKI